MELTQRQRIIFKKVVERFTYCAEPVGSKVLMELLDFPISSATIRNEMATLEKKGLLEKPHTSSGRIPSKFGYRYYVEHLMVTSLEDPIKETLQQVFSQRHYTLDEVVEKSCQILSDMTNLTSVVLGPDASSQKLAHVQLIPVNEKSAVALIITNTGHTENKMFHFDEAVSLEDLKNCTDLMNEQLTGVPINEVFEKMQEIKSLMAAKLIRHEVLFEAFTEAFMKFASEKIIVSGRTNMLYQPEFNDMDKLKKLMKILENSELFKQWANRAKNQAIPIGSRNELIQIGDCSVITAKFHFNDLEEGQLMVIGPNRMQYSKVIALMDYMSHVIEDIFGVHEEGDQSDERKK